MLGRTAHHKAKKAAADSKQAACAAKSRKRKTGKDTGVANKKDNGVTAAVIAEETQQKIQLL